MTRDTECQFHFSTWTRWTLWAFNVPEEKINTKMCLKCIPQNNNFKHITCDVCICGHWPSCDYGCRAAIREAPSTWPCPPNACSIWRKMRIYCRRHKAINSQIKIPSTCRLIQCSDLSIDEWISNPVDQFTTSWLLTTSLPKQKSICSCVKQSVGFPDGHALETHWWVVRNSINPIYLWFTISPIPIPEE